jgi:hypothetical protein
MPGGRPRTVSPPPDECIALGEELIAWVKENKPTHLSEWYSIEKMIPWKMWNAMCELKEFLPYYEQALNIVAKNARNGVLHPSIAQRFLSLYHRDLKADERSEKEFESSLKKQENAVYSQESAEKYSALMNQLSAMQSPSRSCESSNNKDNKS